MIIPEPDSLVKAVPSEVDTPSHVLQALRAHTSRPHLDYANAPVRLGGGFWAEIFAIQFSDPPSELAGELVLRIMPDEALARKEATIQAAVAALGFPAPAVRLFLEPSQGVGRALMIMDRAPGEPLMSGLSGAAAILQIHKLTRRLPRLLAASMFQLHRLDPTPVRRELAGRADDAAIDTSGLLADLIAHAEILGRADLASAGRTLQAIRPPGGGEVICHGDLHPFNLLVADDRVSVLDWTGALLAEPAYDVAFTWLLLTHAPLAAPPTLRPLIRTASRFVGQTFLRSYRASSGGWIASTDLNWYAGLHCLRTQIEAAGWAKAGTLDTKRGHPWITSGAAFAARLRRLTGVPIAEPSDDSRIAPDEDRQSQRCGRVRPRGLHHLLV